ncbi:MAG: RNA pyrophosphohydrolase [Gammaproteobacteria bacterium RIFCSPHIGHO2_12_FULL_42_10]|nr:MAG: RNA pyrophosphohydrolase [Gammaproteobacteria bacterium RIFCSPHIGHO2_12_FULL_42_10]
MIDPAGFRYGIGIILVNHRKQVFLAKRIGMPAWQFPQGGMQGDETPLQTMYRELHEEIGLNEVDVEVIASTKNWLSYRLPHRLRRHHKKPLCVGQKQKWFLLRLTHPDATFNLNANDDPEFDSWAWVSYWHPLKQVISFKRRVYGLALKEFSKLVLGYND